MQGPSEHEGRTFGKSRVEAGLFSFSWSNCLFTLFINGVNQFSDFNFIVEINENTLHI